MYPIRTGEHPNTAFGLCRMPGTLPALPATPVLMDLIETHAHYRFCDGQGMGRYPGSPAVLTSSPSLEEADLMRRIMPVDMFRPWLKGFSRTG